MSLHSDLMNDGVDVLADVFGEKDELVYRPPKGEAIPIALLSRGEVRAGEEDVDVSGGYNKTIKEETLTVRIRGPFPVDLNGEALVPGDSTPWNIKSTRGGGTSVVVLELSRPWKMAVGRSEREK